MLKKILAENTSWNSFGQLYLKGSLFLATIIIARSLGDTIYGQYTFVVAVMQLLQIVLDFGLPLVVVRELAVTTDQHRLIRSVLGLKTTITLISGLLAILLIPLLQRPEFLSLFLIQGGYILITSWNTTIRSIFVATEKFIYEAMVQFVEGSLLIIGVVLIAAKQPVLVSFMWAFVVAALFGLLSTVFLVQKKFFTLTPRFEKKTLHHLIRSAIPLLIANIFVIIYFRIDAIMLSYLSGDAPTGWYNAAYQLMYTLIVLPGIIMMSIYPRLAKLANQHSNNLYQLYRQVLVLMTLLAIVILAPIYFAADWIIFIAYGPAFAPATTVVRILTVAVGISFLAHVWLYTLTAIRQQRFYTYVVAGGMILNIILNLYYIPQFSLYAAAWTTVITELVTAICIAAFCHYQLYAHTRSTT